MKIWFRVHGYEPCSWTFVYNNLRKAFGEIGVTCEAFEQPEHPEDYVELWWGDPHYWRWSDYLVKARVAIALSEARSIFADGREMVISNLKKSDRIICPSESAATAFREAPIDRPIKVIFFGIDPAEFPKVDRTWDGTFNFLHAGVTQFRKGSWLVPEAFVAAFGPEDDVSLTIATPKVTPMFTRLKGEYMDCPNIVFYDELEDSSMSLYEKHHVYVSPHLSEGFGLMIAEAMATGMPCLVARCSAPIEYFSSIYGSWIEMSEKYVPLDQCAEQTAGFWRLPDIDSLVKVMRKTYSDRTQAQAKGDLASEYVAENLTWQHTARAIIDTIKEVLDEKNISSDASSE